MRTAIDLPSVPGGPRGAGLPRSGFLRSVVVLAGGTAFAQGLPILVMPLLTRIYSPGDFGALGIFAALLGMLAVVAGLQYETSIPIPEADETAANLAAVALACVAVTAALTAVAVAVFAGRIAALVNLPGSPATLWLLPIGVAATGGYTTCQYWAVRKKVFPRIARTRLVQSISAAAVQLGAGYAGAGSVGLVSGLVVNNGMGSFGLARGAYRESRAAIGAINWGAMKRAASQFRRFPQFVALEGLANAAAIQVPVLLIAHQVAATEVGFLMLAMRVIQVPMSLVGTAVSQVFYADAVAEHRAGRLAPFTAEVIGNLAKVGVGPLIFAGIVAPTLFGPLFGAGWTRAGLLVAWMTPWFVFQFLASPVSMLLYVTSNQATAMALQLSGFIFRTGTVLLAAALVPGRPVSEVYALSGFVFYLVYLIVLFRAASIPLHQIGRVGRGALLPICGWVAAALLVILLV